MPVARKFVTPRKGTATSIDSPPPPIHRREILAALGYDKALFLRWCRSMACRRVVGARLRRVAVRSDRDVAGTYRLTR